MYGALAGATLTFGLSFVGTKYALAGFHPFLIAFLRFILAGVVLWLWLRVGERRRGIKRERATAGEMARLALLGFISTTVYFAFENLGLTRTSASEAAVIMAGAPLFVIILNPFTLREPTRLRDWVAVIMTMVGIVALVGLGAGGSGDAHDGSLVGNLLMIGACLAAAVYTLMARRLMVKRSAVYLTAYQQLFGALFMVPLVVIEAAAVGVARPTPSAGLALIYLALACSVFGYLWLNYALRHCGVNQVGVFLNLIPVVGVLGAFVLLGERLTVGQALAAIVVVAGVWVANTSSGQPPTGRGY